jgi:hypothetical protein
VTHFLFQAWILITGATSIWLLSSPNAVHRYRACCIGLLGQPFWFISAAENFQWGIFLLSIAYSVSYGRGILNHHRFVPPRDKKQ